MYSFPPERSSQSVDVNGTHYFGASKSASWGSSGHHHHTSVAQSTSIVNSAHTHTTIPSHQFQKHRNPHRATLSSSLSLPDEDYHHYRELSLRAAQEMNPSDPRHKMVPPSFCRAYCLDSRHENDTVSNSKTITQQRSSFGYPTSLFRVTSTADGNLYCLRRMDSVRCVSHKICQTVMHQWLSNTSGREDNAVGFDHPGVVRWYKCFLSQR